MAQEPIPVPTKAPWTKIFTAFKVALDPKKMALAAAGILFTWVGWIAFGAIFYNMHKFYKWEDYEPSVADQADPDKVKAAWTTFKANAEGTLAVYEAARATGVRRIVNFSSECAVGTVPIDVEVGEDIKPAPTNPYGVTKVAGELFGTVYNSLYDMEIVSLRVTEVYGPGLWMPSLLGDMIRAGLRGEPFTLDAGGDHPFQFIHVEDVATAARLAATTTTLTLAVYNVSGGSQITVAETARLLEKLLPGSRYDIGPGLIPAWDSQGRSDLTAAKRDLGYQPAWDLERGFVNQIDWLREQHA